MSAIFGLINKRGLSINQTQIELMSRQLRHHSIDGEGIFLHNDAMLGYHQLTLHSSQKNGRIPFECDDYVIVADARLDNRIDLAKLLNINIKADELFDAHLLLEAFKKWGNQCVDYLEGEFSFLIYHKPDKSFFAATDHIGHRNFFYYDSADYFIFASEIKAILAVKPHPHYFNEQTIFHYFLKSYETHTHIKDIVALTGAHWLNYTTEGLTKHKYWTPQILNKYCFRTLAQWGECLRDLMEGAIRNRIETDYPIGVMLSGGLDSTFVTCILSQVLYQQNRSFFSFSSVADNHSKADDERYYIELLGNYFANIEQVFVTPPKEAGSFENLEKLFENGDGFFNIFHYLDTALLEAAQDKRIRVLLNGYGGDHAISNKRNEYLYSAVKDMKLNKAVRTFKDIKKNYGVSTFHLLKTDILSYTPFYGIIKSLIRNPAYKNLICFNKEIENHILAAEKDEIIDLKSWLMEEISLGNLGRTEQDFNYCDARFNLRKTTPYFDKKILEFYLDIPDDILFENGFRRGLIREAMRGIAPPEIVWRTDKKAYSPDFSSRLTRIKSKVNALLYEPEYDSISNYMNKKKLVANVNNVDNRYVLSIMLLFFIQHQKNKGINLA